jgi:hypothetical protein
VLWFVKKCNPGALNKLARHVTGVLTREDCRLQGLIIDFQSTDEHRAASPMPLGHPGNAQQRHNFSDAQNGVSDRFSVGVPFVTASGLQA